MGKCFVAAHRILLAALLLVVSAAATGAAPPGAQRTAPWNSETTDLEADDRIVYGQLANGLRYAIRHNERPQNQVLVRMTLDFGSAAETEDEQGLAHFIEHMAFNGSTNVPEGEMVRKLERLGLSFGADTNASTGFLQTQYKLDLPKADPELIQQALFLMRETASELLFNPDAIDRERGVVIAEMRDRENFALQRTRAVSALLYPGSFYAERFPIGKLEVLQSASADRLRALYRRWYLPDRARIVVVGPIDPIAIEREIIRRFGSWAGSGKALGDIDRCGFDNARPAGADIFVHPEISEALNIEQIVADRPRPDNFERAMLDLRMRIAGSILADRVNRLRRRQDVPLLGTSLSFAAGFCDAHARIGMTVSAKDGTWKTALPIAEQLLRQAVEHGFSAQEVGEQLKRYDAAFANAVAAEPTTASGVFVAELAGLDEDIVTSAAYRQRLWIQLRPFMTAELVSREFSRWFGQLDRPQIFLSTRDAGGAGATDLLNAYAASRTVAVAPPGARAALSWQYDDFGDRGAVVEDKRIADLDIRTLRFANGVMLNLKRTDFEQDRIRWSLRIDGGRLALAPDQQALAMLMDGAFVGGGLGRYDVDDLRAVLAGSTASPAFAAGTDHYGGQGAIVRRDLERQLQLLAALITDPGYRDEAVRLFKKPLPEFYSRLDATPASALVQGQAKIVSGNNPRFVLPPIEAIESADFAQLKTALADRLARGPIEIGLVGDFDEQDAIDAVARTLGALPARATTPAEYPAQRESGFGNAFGIHTLYHRGEANQLAWRRVWPTSDDSDFRLEQTLSLLADIVQIRLLDELREKLGATYSVSTSSDMSDIFKGRGTFAITTNGDVKDLAEIEAAVDKVLAEILAEPVAPDLFERARKPTLERYADWRRRNATWLGIVDEAQTAPDRLQRFRDNEKFYRSITPHDVWQAARSFLVADRSYIFRVLPKPAG